MPPHMRFVARNEPFGISVYDRDEGKIYVLMGITDISQSRVILRDGEKAIAVTPEEIDFIPTVAKRKDILVGPIYAEIYPTLACNERCAFCYMGDVLVNTMPAMPKYIVDATVRQLRNVGTFETSILGGEPFLWKNLGYLVTALDDAGINISVSTNGTVLNKDLFRKITEMDVKLSFSFHSHIPEVYDAITQKHGAAKLAIKTLDFLKSIGHPPPISIVANSMNIDHLADTVEFVCKKGVKGISIYHTMKSGFSGSDARNIGIPFARYLKAFSQAKKVGEKYGAAVEVVTNFRFLAKPELVFDRNLGDLANLFYGTTDGRRAVYVNYDGKVYSTSYRFGTEGFAMGNIVTQDLSDMWNNSPAIEQFRRAQPPLQCNGCSYFDICRGGPVSNYAPTLLRKSQTEPMSCPLQEINISE